jgi:glycosyltransferase involved in cell wall biosynthesis
VSSRPTVAIDVTPMIGVRTGIGRVVAEIYDALARLEAAPTLVPYTLSRKARQHRDELPEGTRFVPIPARLLIPAWSRYDAPRIDRWLRPAQLIHATNHLTPPSRLPTLVTIHDCSFVRYPELCTPQVRAVAPIVRRAVQRGATLHATSEFVANEIEELFGPGLRRSGRLVVIPFAVPEIGGEAKMPPIVARRLEGRPYVLAIGTLEPRKNLPHLVAAFGAVAAAQPDLHLVIAGPDGPARPDVDAAVVRLGADVAARVILAGPVSEPGRRALLEGAALVAYPSIYEGFGFPALEAMTLGVPVVAARAGAIPEVVGDAALLVEPTDVAELSAAMTRLLTDEDARREYIARGRDRVRAFSWEDTARALASCYRRLVELPSRVS